MEFNLLRSEAAVISAFPPPRPLTRPDEDKPRTRECPQEALFMLPGSRSCITHLGDARQLSYFCKLLSLHYRSISSPAFSNPRPRSFCGSQLGGALGVAFLGNESLPPTQSLSTLVVGVTPSLGTLPYPSLPHPSKLHPNFIQQPIDI